MGPGLGDILVGNDKDSAKMLHPQLKHKIKRSRKRRTEAKPKGQIKTKRNESSSGLVFVFIKVRQVLRLKFGNVRFLFNMIYTGILYHQVNCKVEEPLPTEKSNIYPKVRKKRSR